MVQKITADLLTLRNIGHIEEYQAAAGETLSEFGDWMRLLKYRVQYRTCAILRALCFQIQLIVVT
jgi:hypothetical protein